VFVRANNLTSYVRLDGPPGAMPLLMIHSLGTSGAIWDEQAASLAGPFRIIRPDLRGHGISELTPGPYTVARLAQDMLALLDHLEVERVHVAGISIGGLIAQSLAAQAPGRVASLMLVATALTIPSAESWIERAALVRREGIAPVLDMALSRWVSPAFLDHPMADGLRAMLARTTPEGYAAGCEALAEADLTETTQRLTVPALVLSGERDVATPPAAGRALHEALAGSRFVVLPGASHTPSVEYAEAVTNALRKFLQPETEDRHEAGTAMRRSVLGDEYVDRAIARTTPFDREFQAFLTRVAWGGVWARPQLTPRERCLISIALMAALGHDHELRVLMRACRATGASPQDVSETLMHTGVYAGMPAANSAMRIAKETVGREPSELQD